MSEFEAFDISSPSLEYTKFLEFAESLKIPVNQEYLDQIRSHLGEAQSGSYVDVGVKDSKGHETSNERRLQNALWRAWWRQRKARFDTGSQTLPPQEESLDNMAGSHVSVWGKDIGDIPTEYNINDLQAHELPVIGTYVDPNVLPGFRYRVRLGGGKEEEYLFDGKALLLTRVGPGYGKRLSFEDKDILCNENFFWSDSNPDGGFAFSIHCLSEGERFGVFDCENKLAGDVLITQVNPEQQLLSSKIDNSGATLTASVKFQYKFLPQEETFASQNEEISVSANVTTFKPIKSKVPTATEITGIQLPEMGHCILRNI